VSFFLKSQVPVPVLKQIWAIASKGQPEMRSAEFFTALRLIALAQRGLPINAQTLDQTRGMTLPLPEFQGIEVPKPQPQKPQPVMGTPVSQQSGSPWAVSAEAKSNYVKLWEGVSKNSQGMMEGKEAALFLAKSGLNRDALRTIWQLSDATTDGKLDLTEFIVAMHLTMMAKKGQPLPSAVPPELLQSAKPAASGSQSAISASAAAAPLSSRYALALFARARAHTHTNHSPNAKKAACRSVCGGGNSQQLVSPRR